MMEAVATVAMERDASRPAFWRRFVAPLLLLALVVGHVAWHLSHVEHGYASPDANGYYAQGALLATEGRTGYAPESPLQYIGIHWLETEDGRFVSRYPAGLPAVLAVSWWIAGPDAPFYVDALLTSLTLLFLFLLCRPWVGNPLALVAVLVYAVHPTANHHAHFRFAHTAVGFFLVAGLWLLDWWGRSPSRAKAFGAGILLGIVPTIRYAEAVAGLGIGVFLLWTVLRRRDRVADIGFALLGAAIPLGALALHNQLAYGAPWYTGYRLTNEQSGFSWAWFEQHLESYVDALMTGGAGLYFGLAMVGMGGMFARRETRPLSALLILVILPVTVIYTAYYWGSGGRGLRFLLPTLPLYLLPALWVFRQLQSRAVAAFGLVALLGITLARGIPESRAQVADQQERNRRSAVAASWVRERIPAGSIIVGNRGIHDILQYYGRWKLAEEELLLGRGRGRRPGGIGAGFGRGPDAPSPMQRGKGEKLRAKYRELDESERPLEALNDLLAWAGDERDIFWIGRRSQVEAFEDATAGAEVFVKVGEFEVPPAERPEGGDRPGRRPRAGPGGLMGRVRAGRVGMGGPIGGRRGPPGRSRRGGGADGGPMRGLSTGSYEVFRLEK